MDTQTTQQMELQHSEIKVKLKLATLWTSFMFLYIYIDYFHLYMPNTLANILKARVFVFDITQVFLLIALVSVTIPAIMIALSAILPVKINRCLNIGIAIIYIPYTLFNLAGESWIHMFFGAFVEVVLLSLIIFNAFDWKRNEKYNSKIG
ncbi:DUF6326 family protein [Flavobacterium sp. UMI-01]|uniref:DUF6326 family protein n=1 Tax=Flavobacterium sp. UMI-01 TaxID=1441053 RepID=UPI001C7D6B0A|nr:DUF6326 family protein [Flavobacterium sp. UMI-01]GIZ07758.1 hypothetical protein FUMI01_04850 [Flavobacterium sp. UMI-01]